MKNMKNLIYSLTTALIFAFSISTFAQFPPPPNNNNGAPSDGSTPVGGGGAPIGSGLVVLLALGAGYGAKKIYSSSKKKLAE